MKKKKSTISKMLFSLTGVSGVTITSGLLAYDKIFHKVTRPNYDLYPGQYNIDRIPSLKRNEIWIDSDESKLKTYVYDTKKPKGLVVVAHGLNAGADEYLPIIEYLVDHHFSVIAHNVTGTYESEGDTTIGACQSLIDLESVLTYIENSEYQHYPLFLLGHSWGGYACSSVLALKQNIKACALLAPMCDAPNIMTDKGKQYAGKVANITKPIFDVYQKMLFEDYVKYNGIIGINSTNIPVLIAHGVDDKIITYNQQSITSRKSEITNPNVIYYTGKGLNGGHESIWHSIDSEAYKLVIKSDLKLLEMEKGDKLTDEEKVQYYKTVDHRLYSEINIPLMEQIVDLFNSNLKTKHLKKGE